jgi:hypothetical protein
MPPQNSGCASGFSYRGWYVQSPTNSYKRMAELTIDEQRQGLWHLPAACDHRKIALKIFTMLTEGYDARFETVSHAVLLFDRFLWHSLQTKGDDLTPHFIQVISMAIFLIVSKLRDTSSPGIGGLMKVCSCLLKVNIDEILASEEEILSTIDWNIHFNTGWLDLSCDDILSPFDENEHHLKSTSKVFLFAETSFE